MKWIFNIWLLLITVSAFAQQGVYDKNSKLIFIIENGRISAPESDTILTVRGNIIFFGTSNKADDIIMSTDARDVYQKGRGNVYNRDGSNAGWYISRGNIYFAQFREENAVANIVKTDDYLAFYNAMNDSLLAFIPETPEYSPAEILALFQLMWQMYDLEEQFNQTRNTVQATQGGIIGSMEPTWGGGVVWLWDGKFLFPAHNNNQFMVWQFSNNVLRPKLNPRNHEEWRWDGDSLRPYWGGHPQNEWSWRGGILRQVWANNHLNEFIIDNDNIARPRFGNLGENEWQIQGNIPLPVITAVLLGIVYR
jgi:hypothetical protein